MDLQQTLLALGDETSRNLEFAHRDDVFVSYGEETITEHNLLEIRRWNSRITHIKTFHKGRARNNSPSSACSEIFFLISPAPVRAESSRLKHTAICHYGVRGRFRQSRPVLHWCSQCPNISLGPGERSFTSEASSEALLQASIHSQSQPGPEPLPRALLAVVQAQGRGPVRASGWGRCAPRPVKRPIVFQARLSLGPRCCDDSDGPCSPCWQRQAQFERDADEASAGTWSAGLIKAVESMERA